MKILQKTICSLMISGAVFAACVVSGVKGGFKFFEMNFFRPRVESAITEKLERVSDSFVNYSSSLSAKFRAFMKEEAVCSYIERSPSSNVLQKRNALENGLFASVPGLEGFRLVEDGGLHIHKSTFKEDVVRETENLVAYKNYTAASKYAIPYAELQKYSWSENAPVFYAEQNKFVFCFAFVDSYGLERGTMAFYVYADDFVSHLVSEGTVAAGTKAVLVDQNEILLNVPFGDAALVAARACEKWKSGDYSEEKIAALDDGREFYLVTAESGTLRLGWICSAEEFVFSRAESAELLLCLFVTLFLFVFMLFNLRRNRMALLKSRIEKFRRNVLKQYAECASDKEKREFLQKILRRRLEINSYLCRSPGRKGAEYSAGADVLLEALWSQLAGAMKPLQEETAVKNKAPADAEDFAPLEETGDVEELATLEEADDVEELLPLEEADDVEELAPLEEADDVEELAPLEETDDEENEVELVSLEEFLREDYPLNKEGNSVDNKNEGAENNFSVGGLDFSDLDDEEKNQNSTKKD